MIYLPSNFHHKKWYLGQSESGGKISQPSAYSCSLWSERSIHSCSSAIPGAFVPEKTQPLYKVKKLSTLVVTD